MSKIRIEFGPQGEPLEIHEKPSSAVAAGTDREQAVKPTCEEGICPTCGQVWGEAASLPLPGEEPVDDRENMFELLK